MAYADLITWNDDLLQANASESVVHDLDVLDIESKRVIADVTSLIEGHLGLGGADKGVIVREHTQAVSRDEWSEAKYDHGEYTALAEQTPVVEMSLGSGDISDVGIAQATDRQLEISSPERGTVTYFGGYRRPDQVLSSPEGNEEVLPTGSGEALEGLTTLPSVLPREIRMAAVNITLHVLQNRAQGNLGRRTQQTIGDQSLTVEGADPNYVEGQLSRLSGAPNKRVLI